MHANKNMARPNKEDVTVFVLGSSQGSQVILSEVKVTEASLPSDSLCRGGSWRWTVGEWEPKKVAHFKQQGSATLALHGQSSSVVVAEVSRPLNHYVILFPYISSVLMRKWRPEEYPPQTRLSHGSRWCVYINADMSIISWLLHVC